jgi:hypothetical protein
VSVVGERAEGRYRAKEAIQNILRLHSVEPSELRHRAEILARPSLVLDSCVIKDCESNAGGRTVTDRVWSSGGLFLHSDKEAAMFNFTSIIFSNC